MDACFTWFYPRVNNNLSNNLRPHFEKHWFRLTDIYHQSLLTTFRREYNVSKTIWLSDLSRVSIFNYIQNCINKHFFGKDLPAQTFDGWDHHWEKSTHKSKLSQSKDFMLNITLLKVRVANTNIRIWVKILKCLIRCSIKSCFLETNYLIIPYS